MTGKRHAILVAASDFPEDDSLTNLRCPLQDVEALGEVLGADNHGGFDHVHILRNEPHYEILKKVNRVIKAAEREDMVVFFYSGHGKLDEAGRLYLATSNTSVDVLEATSVPVSQVKDYFDVSAANQLAIVLDCCYSGAIEKSFTKGSVDEQLNLMSGGKGTFVLTASTGLQTAKENEGDDLSVFTKHLVSGILSG
ncbi:MAG: caspase family protein, partial [Sneathiella sp.]